ncbi:helix-turn-helix domain-containing protein [Sphingobacterium sp. 1.A.4]|uniref:helix-turn-helix domain-containing protein n=1 Tax=Sphingobacterium sp. 1.A.4 TaxID=2044603 RepID=UPI000C0BCD65|nr:helix-turn-helix domain-containing protein [Sphingobacterium sp. 1.A.4]
MKYLELNEQIIAHLIQEKPYLDMDFTLTKLADSLDTSLYHLEKALKLHFEGSIYEYINQLRIEYFISQIDRINAGELNIMALAYESGFRSKSSFRNNFRQIQGISPTAYILKHIKI